jgi:hypothetical protein
VFTTCLLSDGLLNELDGLNPTRALILQAYYAVRRSIPPTDIGVPQILAWIRDHEPGASRPSESLILLTLRQAGVVHRRRGRPRNDRPTPEPAPPFSPSKGLLFHGQARR